MKKLHSKVCWGLFIANTSSYVGLFTLDVLLFNVENVRFTVFYGYFLFPLFFIIHGLVCYKHAKHVVLPNTLYFLLCFLFLTVFTGIGMLFQSNYISIPSPTLYRVSYAMSIIGFCTMISVICSMIGTLITAGFYKLIKLFKKSR